MVATGLRCILTPSFTFYFSSLFGKKTTKISEGDVEQRSKNMLLSVTGYVFNKLFYSTFFMYFHLDFAGKQREGGGTVLDRFLDRLLITFFMYFFLSWFCNRQRGFSKLGFPEASIKLTSVWTLVFFRLKHDVDFVGSSDFPWRYLIFCHIFTEHFFWAFI